MKKFIIFFVFIFVLFIGCKYTPVSPETPGEMGDIDVNDTLNRGFSKPDSQTSSNIVFDITPDRKKGKTFWGIPESQEAEGTLDYLTKNISSISLTTNKTKGSDGAPFGLVFLKNDKPNSNDWNNVFFVAAVITTSGKLSIVRFSNRSWKYLYQTPSSETISSINTGLGATNKIEIIYPNSFQNDGSEATFTESDKFQIKINDKTISINGDTSFSIVTKDESDANIFKIPSTSYSCYTAVSFIYNGSYNQERIEFSKITTNTKSVTN